MKIKMLTRYAGPEGVCQPGKTIELPEKEAQSLLEGRFAMLLKGKFKEVPKPTSASELEDRETEILEAVRMVIDEDDKSKLIASGAPSVGALEDLLDYDITSSERDTAFLKVR